MRPTRVLALVIGCLMLLPGIGLLFAGGASGSATPPGATMPATSKRP